MVKNSIASLDELKSSDKTGNIGIDDLKRMKKYFIFLGVFVMAIIIAAIVLL